MTCSGQAQPWSCVVSLFEATKTFYSGQTQICASELRFVTGLWRGDFRTARGRCCRRVGLSSLSGLASLRGTRAVRVPRPGRFRSCNRFVISTGLIYSMLFAIELLNEGIIKECRCMIKVGEWELNNSMSVALLLLVLISNSGSLLRSALIPFLQ